MKKTFFLLLSKNAIRQKTQEYIRALEDLDLNEYEIERVFEQSLINFQNKVFGLEGIIINLGYNITPELLNQWDMQLRNAGKGSYMELRVPVSQKNPFGAVTINNKTIKELLNALPK